MLKEKEAESIFMFDLQGIDHMNRPVVGEELIITEDVS